MKKTALLVIVVLFLSINLSVNHITRVMSAAAPIEPVSYLPFISRPVPPAWIGPEGGKIISLVVDPKSPDTLYAGTDGTGVFKTTNGGTSWYPVNIGLGNTRILSLGIDPLQPNTVYAGTYRGKLYKSFNGGQSWFLSSVGIQDEAIVYAIAIDPVNPSQLYIATRGISNNGEAPWNGIIYRSVDSGASWQIALNNVPGPDQQDWAYALAVNPISPNSVFAAMHESGIWRSDDFGFEWYPKNGDLLEYSTRDIVFDPHHMPVYAYAGFWHTGGNASNVLKSTDAGLNWAPTDTSMYGVKVFRLTVDPIQADTIYVATMSSQGVMKSKDGGTTWLPSGLANQVIWNVVINPQNSQVVYSGTDGDGVYKSTDAGSSWVHAQTGFKNVSATGVVTLPGDPNTLYVSTLWTGVRKTTNYGASWSDYNLNLNDRTIHGLVQHPTNPNLVYALGDSGGLYSTNISLGNGWTVLNTGLPVITAPVLAFGKDHPFTASLTVDDEVSDALLQPNSAQASTLYSPLLCMTFAPSNSNIVYLGTSGNGVYKSNNGALNWSPVGLAGFRILSLAVDPLNPNLVYAATDVPGSAKVSRDGGVTWDDIPIETLNVYSLAFSSSSPATLYAGTNDGLYQWIEGVGWLYRGLAGKKVTVVATKPSFPGIVYAGTDDGTYTYYEYSGAFYAGPSLLQGHTIQAINFDLNDPARGYFSTSTQGVLLAPIK